MSRLSVVGLGSGSSTASAAAARACHLKGASVVNTNDSARIPHTRISILPQESRARHLQATCHSSHLQKAFSGSLSGMKKEVYPGFPDTAAVLFASECSSPLLLPLAQNSSTSKFVARAQSDLPGDESHCHISRYDDEIQKTAKRKRENGEADGVDQRNKTRTKQVCNGGRWLESHIKCAENGKPAEPRVAVVFFHGLAKSRKYSEVWHSENDKFWPEWLWEDFPETHILTVSYEPYQGSYETLNTFAKQLLNGILSETYLDGKGDRREWWRVPVILVGHSVGGIVARALISAAIDYMGKEERCKTFLQNLQGVIYYSTPSFPEDPHKFENLCNAIYGSRFSPTKPKVRHRDFTGRILLAISKDGGGVMKVLQRFKDHVAGPKGDGGKDLGRIREGSTALFESKSTEMRSFKEIVVPEQPHFGRLESKEAYQKFHKSVKVVESDHFTICKPPNEKGSAYQELHLLMKKVMLRHQPADSS